jgi:hypothetical protein
VPERAANISEQLSAERVKEKNLRRVGGEEEAAGRVEISPSGLGR